MAANHRVKECIHYNGGYDCDYVDGDPPEALCCGVCTLPFREPQLLCCCGKKICESCIERVRLQGKRCPYCNQAIRTVLDKELRSKVLDLAVYCSNRKDGCTWTGELRNVYDHISMSCQLEKPKCRYCREEFIRSYLDMHEKDECIDRPLEVKLDSFKRQVSSQFAQYEDKMALCDSKMAQYESKMAQCDNRMAQYESKMAQCDSKMAQYESKMAAQCDNKMAQCDNKMAQYESKMAQCDNKMAQYESKMAQCDNKMAQCDNKMAQYESKMAQCDSKMAQYESKIAECECKIAQWSTQLVCPPCKLTMNGYTYHKNSKDEWFSPPFYDRPGGYKFCLKVDVNGTGSHVSVYVYLMKGLNDDRLVWPFQGSIEIQLVNQKKHNKSVVIEFDKKAASRGRADRAVMEDTSDLGWGFSQFASHCRVEKVTDRSQYITDDCLTFIIADITIKCSITH